MEQRQKDALRDLLQISNEAVSAITVSDNVALKLKEVVDAVLPKLNGNVDAAQFDLAIKTYIDKSASMTEHINRAVDKLTVVSGRSITGNFNTPTYY